MTACMISYSHSLFFPMVLCAAQLHGMATTLVS